MCVTTAWLVKLTGWLFYLLTFEHAFLIKIQIEYHYSHINSQKYKGEFYPMGSETKICWHLFPSQALMSWHEGRYKQKVEDVYDETSHHDVVPCPPQSQLQVSCKFPWHIGLFCSGDKFLFWLTNFFLKVFNLSAHSLPNRRLFGKLQSHGSSIFQ